MQARAHGLRMSASSDREAHRVCPAKTRISLLSDCVVAPSGATRADKQQAQVAGDLMDNRHVECVPGRPATGFEDVVRKG